MITGEDDRLIIRPADLARQLGVSAMTLWRWGKNGSNFPKKIQLGPNTSGYRRADIDAWLAKRAGEGAP